MIKTDNLHIAWHRLIIMLFLFVCTLAGAQNDKLFEEGNKLYNEGRYQEAIERYKEISDNGMHSAALYFNMGNAYYKLNEIAPSILYYEKASLLAPEDNDIMVNLSYARNMTLDDIEELPQSGFSKLFNGIVGVFGYQTWAYLAIVGMSLFVALFISYYFAYAQGRKRLLFVLSGIFLFLSIMSLVFAFQQREVLDARNPAIIFAEETTVKSEPNLGSNEVFRLHEGAKVFVLDTMDSWKKIRLADGKEGWLPGDELKLVKDF